MAAQLPPPPCRPSSGGATECGLSGSTGQGEDHGGSAIGQRILYCTCSEAFARRGRFTQQNVERMGQAHSLDKL